MAETGQTTGWRSEAREARTGYQEFCFQFCNVSVDLSVYIASLKVLK